MYRLYSIQWGCACLFSSKNFPKNDRPSDSGKTSSSESTNGKSLRGDIYNRVIGNNINDTSGGSECATCGLGSNDGFYSPAAAREDVVTEAV